ncbi:MAG: hypothetical protein KUG52_04520 [Immundisolibacteraceae bacterium]|nr:hypothetical protein [Immundisolibacteraceae bacterium]
MSGSKQPVALAIVGLSSRGLRRLSSFLMEIADEHCQVVEPESAEAFIADVDASDSAWSEFRAHYPDLPTIVLSRHRPDIDDVIWVPKPIMEVALLEAISWARNQVAQRRKSRSKKKRQTGSRHGADMVLDPARLAQATGRREEDATLNIRSFDSSETLLNGLLEAIDRSCKTGRAVALRMAGHGELLVLPREPLVAVSVNADQLLAWAREPSLAGQFVVQGLTAAEQTSAMARLEQYKEILPLEVLLWKLAVWTSRGRLPEGTDANTRFYLRCWPNFTRLMVIPHAVRIAAFWVREPMPPVFVADALAIAPADVFTFYYAAKTIGLAGVAHRDDDYLLANRGAQVDSGSGMQRVVEHIGRNLG